MTDALDPPMAPPAGPVETGSDLDEFIARAVDRQIAEQRSLREHIAALTDAVNTLGASPMFDPDALREDLRTVVRSVIDPVVAEIRLLSDALRSGGPMPQPAGPSGGGGPSVTAGPLPTMDDGAMRSSMTSLQADVGGIAQALIDLNAGLRDWAMNVDRNIAGINETVERIRELASRAEVQRVDATGSRQLAAPDDTQVVVGEFVHDDAGARTIETKIKESNELSLYLADQLEEFDRVIRGMGDLPNKLESVVAQGVRRTLAARSKLDTEAGAAMDDALASLDDYTQRIDGTIERFESSEETLRRIGLGQVEMASRIDALHEAIHALATGGVAQAARLTKPKPVRKAKPTPKPKPKAKAKAKAKPKPKPRARRSTPKD